MADGEFGREQQRIDPATVGGWLAAARGKRRPAAGRQPPGLFLRGPVPLPWLALAGRLPGKALVVGLALWFLCGAKKSRAVRLTSQTLRHLLVERKAAHRALRKLEGAGLVAVARKRGRGPEVTILDAPPPGAPSAAGR